MPHKQSAEYEQQLIEKYAAKGKSEQKAPAMKLSKIRVEQPETVDAEDDFDAQLERAAQEQAVSQATEKDSRYEELEAQIRNLNNQLQAAQGRVAPIQQQAAAYEKMLRDKDAQMQKLLEEQTEQERLLKAQLEDLTRKTTLKELIDEEKLAKLEELGMSKEVIDIFAEASDKLIKINTPRQDIDIDSYVAKEFEKREKAQAERIRAQVQSDKNLGLHKLDEYYNDPEFHAWLQDTPSFGLATAAFLQATDPDLIRSYSKDLSRQLASFANLKKQNNSNATRPTDPVTQSLESGLRRGTDVKANTAKSFEDDMAAVKRLARGRDFDKANELLNKHD